MAIKRGDTPANQPFIEPYGDQFIPMEVPFRELFTAGQVLQGRADKVDAQAQATLNASRIFDRLEVDDPAAEKIQKDYEGMVDSFYEKNPMLSSREAQRDFLAIKNKLASDKRILNLGRNYKEYNAIQKMLDENKHKMDYNAREQLEERQRFLKTGTYGNQETGEVDFNLSPNMLRNTGITEYKDFTAAFERMVDGVVPSGESIARIDPSGYIVTTGGKRIKKSDLEGIMQKRMPAFFGTLDGKNFKNFLKDKGFNTKDPLQVISGFQYFSRGVADENAMNIYSQDIKGDPNYGFKREDEANRERPLYYQGPSIKVSPFGKDGSLFIQEEKVSSRLTEISKLEEGDLEENEAMELSMEKYFLNTKMSNIARIKSRAVKELGLSTPEELENMLYENSSKERRDTERFIEESIKEAGTVNLIDEFEYDWNNPIQLNNNDPSIVMPRLVNKNTGESLDTREMFGSQQYNEGQSIYNSIKHKRYLAKKKHSKALEKVNEIAINSNKALVPTVVDFVKNPKKIGRQEYDPAAIKGEKSFNANPRDWLVYDPKTGKMVDLSSEEALEEFPDVSFRGTTSDYIPNLGRAIYATAKTEGEEFDDRKGSKVTNRNAYYIVPKSQGQASNFFELVAEDDIKYGRGEALERGRDIINSNSQLDKAMEIFNFPSAIPPEGLEIPYRFTGEDEQGNTTTEAFSTTARVNALGQIEIDNPLYGILRSAPKTIKANNIPEAKALIKESAEYVKKLR